MAKNWAIAIGINRYDNLPMLNYAQRDAELMRDWFLNEAGFEQVYLFTGNSPPITDAGKPFASQPTYGTLKRFLRVRFNKPFLSAGDNLWFFFSGHGLRHADRDYLMPSDADPHPEGVEDTAIPLNYVTERLRRCGADNVVLILDACRNQGAKGLGVGEEEQQGVITIASCSPSERSYEIDEIEQGSFTYALLETLRIQGEGNCATVERLYQRLRYRVGEINRYYHKPIQTPYAVVEPATKYHLILLPRYATLRDAETLKLDALNAEVNGEYDLAEQLWIRVLAVSPADTDAINAIRRLAQSPDQPESYRSQGARSSSGGSRSGNRLTRRRLLQGSGLAGAGLVVTLLVRSLLEFFSKPETVPSPSKIIPDSIETTKPTDETPISTSEFEFEVVTVNAQGKETNRRSSQAKFFSEDLDNGVTLEMVSIPGGTFMMGAPKEEEGSSDDERPQHEVTVKPFFMGKFQVTQAQWQAVMHNNPSHFKGDKRPVEQVSWSDAVEFCKRLSEKTGREYRLPSEAEWEYACRAVIREQSSATSEKLTVEEWNEKYHQPFHFGETITTDLANYRGTDWEYKGKKYPGSYGKGPKGEFLEETKPVGTFPPNAFGLYDLHGNVWEWCADPWHDNYEGAQTDGSAWETGGNKSYRVLRGGSWGDQPVFCRSAYRLNNVPVNGGNYIGFRVVCVPARTP